MRVATLNLWGRFADWPRRRELLAEQLPALAIDVYLLQEVVRGDAGDQLLELGELLGYEFTARVVAESRPHEQEHEGVAILSRLPLHSTGVWPLPPSQPRRHLLEATIDWDGEPLRLVTLHAAVSNGDGRDAQIAALAADVHASPVVIGCDLNAPTWIVRPLVETAFRDSLDWDEQPTWPVDEEAWRRAWNAKLGESPGRDPEPRRLDYLLYRGVEVTASEAVELRGASDHRLVWVDLKHR